MYQLLMALLRGKPAKVVPEVLAARHSIHGLILLPAGPSHLSRGARATAGLRAPFKLYSALLCSY